MKIKEQKYLAKMELEKVKKAEEEKNIRKHINVYGKN